MSRRATATIRTTHADPELVANAVTPDETAEMETTLEDGAVVTRIDRETTGGLHATVDDYVVNVDVATTVAQHANRDDQDAGDASTNPDSDAGPASDPEHDNT